MCWYLSCATEEKVAANAFIDFSPLRKRTLGRIEFPPISERKVNNCLATDMTSCIPLHFIYSCCDIGLSFSFWRYQPKYIERTCYFSCHLKCDAQISQMRCIQKDETFSLAEKNIPAWNNLACELENETHEAKQGPTRSRPVCYAQLWGGDPE